VRTSDLVRLSVSALWRQKTRTVLTALGVILGACMLAFSLSIGQGVKEALRRQFRNHEDLRRIQIYPGFGEQTDENGIPPDAIAVKGDMSDERRARLRRQLVQNWHNANTRRALVPIDREMLDRLAGIEFVESVVPNFNELGRLSIGGKTIGVTLRPVAVENRAVPHQIVFGAIPAANDSRSVLVHEFLLYQIGIRDDSAVTARIGKPIRLEVNNQRRGTPQFLSMMGAQVDTLSTEETQLLERVVKLLPLALERLELSTAEKAALRDLIKRRDTLVNPPQELVLTEEFTLAGVLRSLDPKEEKEFHFLERTINPTDVMLPYVAGRQFCDQLPRRQDSGYDGATLTIDKEENVRAVVEEIKGLGVHHYSAVEFVEHVLRDIKLMNFATTFIAGVALFVAGLGITNTMVTSVLERIQEIGIMKAVGAKDRHIQTMFLLEGAMLGLIGGLLGLVLTWVLSLPGDGYARKLMAEQTEQAVEQSLFVWPTWLLVSVPLFAMLTTTLAALYPARRAAKVDPIQALRHE
jgi:putative ABC transport system permease protein